MPEDNSRKVEGEVSGRPLRKRESVGTGHVLNLYKRMGETPRERLERLRIERPRYALEVLSYAGRLDPLAEGILLALVGGENLRREAHLGLDKEYTLDILFGFATDSYDVLGRVTDQGSTETICRRVVADGLREFQGNISQEYPPFSSKTIEGRPMFELARNGMLENIVLPRKSLNIYNISLGEMYKVSEKELLEYIEDAVSRVNGDFRQEEILRIWHKALEKKGTRTFPCATVKIECSSGTYARSIAHTLGQNLDVPALALHILRTRVGEHMLKDAIK